MTRALIVDDDAQRKKTDASASFFAAVKRAIVSNSRVAFDCEGAGLSRVGTLEIVSLFLRRVMLLRVALRSPIW